MCVYIYLSIQTFILGKTTLEAHLNLYVPANVLPLPSITPNDYTWHYYHHESPIWISRRRNYQTHYPVVVYEYGQSCTAVSAPNDIKVYRWDVRHVYIIFVNKCMDVYVRMYVCVYVRIYIYIYMHMLYVYCV